MTQETMKLRAAWRFFLEHAGYCTPPGRAACALMLARAEAWAREQELSYLWEADFPADYQDDKGAWHQAPAKSCVVYQLCPKCQEPRTVATLGGIMGADSDYRRVVQAELAAQARAGA